MTSHPPTKQPCCANIEYASSDKESTCLGTASFVCQGCFLVQVKSAYLESPLILTKMTVQYCGKSCQQTHWSIHKGDCKSPLMKATWRPSWVVEARRPAFINDDQNQFVDMLAHGRQKYLWGNVPAIDILNLQQNEGVDFTGDLRLLFAGTRYATRLDPLLTPK